MSRNTTNSRLPALAVALGCACLGAPALSQAQAASQPMASGAKGAALAAADETFAKKAAIGGMAEVEMGKLVQQKAASADVKQFGTRMVDDHSKANDELKQLASSKGLALPSDLDAEHKTKLAKLQKLSGTQLDRAYMDDMVADHKHDVADFRKESKSGHDAELKAFAAKTLPTLEDHLKQAQATDQAVKKGGAMSAPSH